MFNKEKFSNILNKINNDYPTMTEFAKKASWDRSYISKYINQKLDNPPTPKKLLGISNASNGLVTYEELMQLCGYMNLAGVYDMDLDSNEMNILSKILQDYKEFLRTNTDPLSTFDEYKYLSHLSKKSKEKIIILFRRNSLDLILNNSKTDTEDNKYFEFVSEDDAMFPLLDIGDIALVYKQNTIDETNASSNNAGTYLIKLNGKNTIRRFLESQDKISYILEGMNIACKSMNIKKIDLSKNIVILGRVVETKNKSAFKRR